MRALSYHECRAATTGCRPGPGTVFNPTLPKSSSSESCKRRAAALELGPSESPLSVEVHGFISQGVLRTTANNYLARSDSGIGSFEFTEIGINFTKSLTDRLRFGLQLFSRDLGPAGDYTAKAD